MIISPPFLPERGADSEETWLGNAMVLDQTEKTKVPLGCYPVSRQLGWHGGVHLVAPKVNKVALPVRAIADGQIVFVRQNSPEQVNLTTGLYYNSESTGPSRTDDGCVVIRHQTEIGAAPGTATAEGAATSLTYYSVYMHLSKVTCTTQASASAAAPIAIYRKDAIGLAGSIYGQPDRLHFEIVFDEAALTSLLGRSMVVPTLPPKPKGLDSPEVLKLVSAAEAAAKAGATAANNAKDASLNLAATANGRVDAVFGEIYFRLPIGTPYYADTQLPANHVLVPETPVAHRLKEERIVGMRFAAGEGADGHRGDIIYQTYQPNGTPEGLYLFDANAEYNLYTRATKISHDYPASGRPAPSAVFELLRFGRIIDTAHETLSPADVPMWQRLNYPGGHGYVNLHAAGVQVYSDADLPQWKGWKLVNSDADGDSRCDAASVREILDENSDGKITPEEEAKQIGVPKVREKLSKLLCKMPTEWDAANIDKRYDWLMVQTDENPDPLVKEAKPAVAQSPGFHPEREYKPFKEHVEALCFWNKDAIGLDATHWHAHPVEFIRHFRKCGWMSQSELSNVLSRTPHGSADRASRLRQVQNTLLRKFAISSTKLRITHFFAQIGHESGWWRYKKELGEDRYFRTMYEIITPEEATADFEDGTAKRLGLTEKNDTAETYSARRPSEVAAKAHGMDNGSANSAAGGLAGDGARFCGRGFMQLTGRRNYAAYGVYRGRGFSTDQASEEIFSNDYFACDTSNYFWAREKLNLEADAGATQDIVQRVGGAVNRGNPEKLPKHADERLVAFNSIWGNINDQI